MKSNTTYVTLCNLDGALVVTLGIIKLLQQEVRRDFVHMLILGDLQFEACLLSFYSNNI